MLDLESAIKYCEEIAEEEDQKIKRWNGDYPHLKKIDSCEKYAAEHRQLADWLNELKRARILLEATHNLLEKQMESGYVLNLLAETVFYGEAECDGHCLMEDIENLLKYHV